MTKKEQKNLHFYFFSLAAIGKGLSGGDRIFIELARRWVKEFPINLYLWKDGREMCRRQKLTGDQLSYKISSVPSLFRGNFWITYFYLIFEGIALGLTINPEKKKELILYSSSDLWMDILPAFLLKLRFPQVKWIATWYQTAPKPWRGFSEGGRESRYTLSAFFYWFSQLVSKPIINKFADKVIVNNETERSQFSQLNKKGKVAVILGGVDVSSIERWKERHSVLKKKFDAVFQGRFHPQKGVVELVEIWKLVVEKIPQAKLAMIGDGPLMRDVKREIKKYSLEDNIKLFGYVFDGPKKYRIFQSSKLVVHPAFYDSGGMASAEAMAFGLPCVGFDLKAYTSYYPKGMVKVPIGDMQEFSKKILWLLKNNKERNRIGKQAYEMIRKSWSWDSRASYILNFVQGA